DVGRHLIQTTSEHPFFVREKGWVHADQLQLGDLLVGHDEVTVPVLRLAQTGRVATVYNIRVAEDHTYFVGDPEWGFSVWVHNAYSVQEAANGLFNVVDGAGNIVRRGVKSIEEASDLAKGFDAGFSGAIQFGKNVDKKLRKHIDQVRNRGATKDPIPA